MFGIRLACSSECQIISLSHPINKYLHSSNRMAISLQPHQNTIATTVPSNTLTTTQNTKAMLKNAI